MLADRALHAAARRHLAAGPGADAHRLNALTVSAEDLADAQQGFQPAAAWGVGHLQVTPNLPYPPSSSPLPIHHCSH